MKKLGIFILFLLILGSYVGFGRFDKGICNGPYKQSALQLTISKPFIAGYWNIWLGIGNKHWDYKEEKIEWDQIVCKDNVTGNTTAPRDYRDVKKFTQHCEWLNKSRVEKSGCAFWYNQGWDLEGGFIDLTPWSTKIRKDDNN